LIRDFLEFQNLKICGVLLSKIESANIYIRCSFKFSLKVGVEESIVNVPLVVGRVKIQTTQKVRLDLNQ
jgi:hypothetical protein